MLDVVLKVNQDKEFTSSVEKIKTTLEGSEVLRITNAK